MASYVVLRGEDAGFDPDGLAVLEGLGPVQIDQDDDEDVEVEVDSDF